MEQQPLSPGQVLARSGVIGAIVGGVAILFAYAGGWLSPRALSPKDVIDTFQQVSGVHPGFRRNHAKGVCFSGYFDSNGSAAAVSKATLFVAGRTPVIGRFSVSGGEPFQADTPTTVRAMALLFQMNGGEQWRTAMVNLPVFPFSTPAEFVEQLRANAPDAATGKPDPSKMQAIIAANPETAAAIKIIKASPHAKSFAGDSFSGLNAFRFIAADGTVTFVRWTFRPEQAATPASQPSLAEDKNAFFDALIVAIHERPLRWRLLLTLAAAGDPTDDAARMWPADRKTIDAGTLTIDQVQAEEDSPARDINFDPLVLPVGIAPSDDPLLSARSAAYAVSYKRREGEAKTAGAITPAEVSR